MILLEIIIYQNTGLVFIKAEDHVLIHVRMALYFQHHILKESLYPRDDRVFISNESTTNTSIRELSHWLFNTAKTKLTYESKSQLQYIVLEYCHSKGADCGISHKAADRTDGFA